MPEETTISNILMEQAYESLLAALEFKKVNKVDKELQLSINVILLLAISLEGMINEVSKLILDKPTYDHLQKSTTPLKWIFISALLPEVPNSTKMPLKTIATLSTLRNKIAHPKSNSLKNDVIIASSKKLHFNPKDRNKLPEGDLKVYIGYQELYRKFNAKDSLKYMKDVVVAIKKIKTMFSLGENFKWIESVEDRLKNLH